MAGKRYFLVMNPASRSGRGRMACEKILSALGAKKANFNYRMTTAPEEAVSISAEATRNNYEVVVAVGGDGTIREVITGLFLDGNSNHDVKLGVLHIGTSPDFNRYHNIPVRLDRAIDALLRNKSKPIDIGKITYMKAPSQKAIAYFGSNVNIGLGPLIASRANSRHRKYLGDFLGTLCATLGSLVSFKGIDLEIKIDNKKVNPSTLINLTIGKDPYLASGMRIFNDIAPDDGRFYILSIKKMPYISYLAHIPRLYMGDFLKFKGASIEYGKEVEITSSAPNALVEFDGDTTGYIPAKIEIIPKALEVIVA